jgi:hypothetical protein
MIGAKVEENVETKLYALTTFPEFWEELVFYIIVIAGAKYEPEINIVRDANAIDK